MGTLYGPNGKRIVGTLENVPGVAGITSVTRNPDGGYEIENDGYTEMHWDDQETIELNGEVIYVDEDGNHWRESTLTYSDNDEDGNDALERQTDSLSTEGQQFQAP